MAQRDHRGRHEADIVAVAGMASARIAEPDDEPHRRRPACRRWRYAAGVGVGVGAASSVVGAAAAVAAACAASSRTAEEAAMLAIVKSRSWITGRARLRQRDRADMDAVADVEPVEIDDQPIGNGVD